MEVINSCFLNLLRILYFTTFQDGSGVTTIFSASLDSPKTLNEITTIPYICTAMAVDFNSEQPTYNTIFNYIIQLKNYLEK